MKARSEHSLPQCLRWGLAASVIALILTACATPPAITKTAAPSPTAIISPSPTAAWTSTHPMLLGVTLDAACYHYPGHPYGPIDEPGALGEVDAAVALCADLVRIDVRNETLHFDDEVAKLDRIIAYAQEKGMAAYIGAYGMETWMPDLATMFAHQGGGAGKASWGQFQRMYLAQVRELTGRYHPEYLEILPEVPLNIGNQINSQRTLDEWVAFADEAAAAAREIDQDVCVVVNVIARDGMSTLLFAKMLAAKSQGVDILGIDPYSPSEFADEFDNIRNLANRYDWDGELWVAETNLLHPTSDEEQCKYLLDAYRQAEQAGFGGFIVFYFRDIPGICDERGIISNDFLPQVAYRALQELRGCATPRP